MKIAILTAFRNMPDTYSLVHDVIDQVKTLNKYGHDVVFFGQVGCEGKGIECEVRPVMPHFRVEKGVVNQEVKQKFIEVLEKELKDFDVAITHDLTYLQGYVTQLEAIKEVKLPNIKWIHWCHSGVGGRLNIKMPKSKYIYMNYVDIKRFAESIGVEYDDVRVVYNDKDPRLFFEWHPITIQIADKYDLLNRDIIQTYPMCSTRMDAKGLNTVIKLFAHLKRLGNKVLLIVPNANARMKGEEIQNKIKLAKDSGLDDDEIVFTSTISDDLIRGVPRKVVRDLMQISNLFIFPTISEVCSNVLLEASMTKQLIVLNKDFPALFDFGEDNKTCIGANFGSLLRAGFKYRTEGEFAKLAKIINQQLLSSKSNRQFLKILRECNIDTIYRRQLEPILYEDF